MGLLMTGTERLEKCYHVMGDWRHRSWKEEGAAMVMVSFGSDHHDIWTPWQNSKSETNEKNTAKEKQVLTKSKSLIFVCSVEFECAIK